MECSSVQVLRPSSSTSGGQSFRMVGAAATVLSDLVCDEKAANELQVRQLRDQNVSEDPHGFLEIALVRTVCHLCQGRGP